MSVLNSVLMYGKPHYWEDASYTGRLYQLFDLQPGDPEYTAEVRKFERGISRMTVTSLQRYQNPTLLGKLKVRKDHLFYKGDVVKEMKYYHPINKCDLNIALEFNMDVRRYNNYNGVTKDPVFYKTPDEAYNNIRGVSEKVILICSVLSEYDEDCISKQNDAEYMPTYVAEVE